MRCFKTKAFSRFAAREAIGDSMLCDAVQRLESGLIDADLGGDVYKQRLARPGRGKSGGYRSIILFRLKEHAFFVFGYAKKDQANIKPDEKRAFRLLASELFGLNEIEIEAACQNGTLVEVVCYAKTVQK